MTVDDSEELVSGLFAVFFIVFLGLYLWIDIDLLDGLEFDLSVIHGTNFGRLAPHPRF